MENSKSENMNNWICMRVCYSIFFLLSECNENDFNEEKFKQIFVSQANENELNAFSMLKYLRFKAGYFALSSQVKSSKHIIFTIDNKENCMAKG